MELIQIVLAIIAAACFFEYEHLNKNNIRHDELKFLYMGFIVIVLLIITLFFETEDLPGIF